MKVVHTDGKNSDFIDLCRELDNELDEMVGGHVQRENYDQYNQLDDIHDVILIYLEEKAVAGGSFKFYEKGIAEIKRIFVRKEARRRGFARKIMNELEIKAKTAGYRKLILETGKVLSSSILLYRSVGFKIIDNYGQYKEMNESVCLGKELG